MSIRWTIGQACVWLATADAKAANKTSARAPILQLDDEITPAHNRPRVIDALRELQDHWRAGDLMITGRQRGKGEPEDIKATATADWKLQDYLSDDLVRLEPLDWLDGESPRHGKPLTGWWSDLSVSAEAVQALWPAPVLWTVPQACVWIRTRDLGAVAKLTPREAASIALLGFVSPGAFEARHCLKAALERGRFTARGRAAQLAMATDTGKLQHWLLDEHAQFIPQAFWQDGGDFSDHDLNVIATAPERDPDKPARPGEEGEPQDYPRRWVRIELERDDVMGHWQAPYNVLRDGPVPLGYLVEYGALHDGPEDNWGWFLSRDDVTVTGLDGLGRRVPIDRLTLSMPSATFTIEGDGLTIGTNLPRWGVIASDGFPLHRSSVFVELHRRPVTQAPPPAPTLRGSLILGPAPEQHPQDVAPVLRARQGRPSDGQARIREYVTRTYPQGTDKTTATLKQELAGAGIHYSETTIERALGRRRDGDRSSKPRPNK